MWVYKKGSEHNFKEKKKVIKKKGEVISYTPSFSLSQQPLPHSMQWLIGNLSRQLVLVLIFVYGMRAHLEQSSSTYPVTYPSQSFSSSLVPPLLLLLPFLNLSLSLSLSLSLCYLLSIFNLLLRHLISFPSHSNYFFTCPHSPLSFHNLSSHFLFFSLLLLVSPFTLRLFFFIHSFHFF